MNRKEAIQSLKRWYKFGLLVECGNDVVAFSTGRQSTIDKFFNALDALGIDTEDVTYRQKLNMAHPVIINSRKKYNAIAIIGNFGDIVR